MKNIITYTLLVLKAIAAAFIVFIAFVFILDTYQKRERAKKLKEEQTESLYEYTIGTWSKYRSCEVKDNRLNGLTAIRFDEHRNCVFSYIDHSEFGTYSLDLDSIYVEMKPEGTIKDPQRYSYGLTTQYEPYTGFVLMVISSGPNCSVVFKRAK